MSSGIFGSMMSSWGREDGERKEERDEEREEEREEERILQTKTDTTPLSLPHPQFHTPLLREPESYC